MTTSPLPAGLLRAPAFARAAALTHGVTDVQLRRRRLTRVTQGWYSADLDPADTVGRCTALLEALPDDAVFSDATAARLYGLPVPTFVNPVIAPVHVTLSPRPVVPQRREVVVHQRALPPRFVRQVRGLPVTSPERLYADLAMSLSREDLVVVGDAILRQELAGLTALHDFLAASNPRRGLRLARAVLSLLDDRAKSPQETVLRLRLRDAGLPTEPQCPVVDGAGQVIGRADLGYRAKRVALVQDGRRYSRFAAAGWLVLRWRRRDLADASQGLIARVRAALDAR